MIFLVPSVLIPYFGIKLSLIKKFVVKDKEFESSEVRYIKTNKVSFTGVVLKSSDDKIFTFSMNAEDKASVFKVYTLNKDIKEEDLVIMNSRNYKVTLVNNHTFRSINYLDFYMTETAKEIE